MAVTTCRAMTLPIQGMLHDTLYRLMQGVLQQKFNNKSQHDKSQCVTRPLICKFGIELYQLPRVSLEACTSWLRP